MGSVFIFQQGSVSLFNFLKFECVKIKFALKTAVFFVQKEVCSYYFTYFYKERYLFRFNVKKTFGPLNFFFFFPNDLYIVLVIKYHNLD